MAKLALLIGVSQYQLDFSPLPATEQDVQEMQRVLEHPDIGGFHEVKSLTNPSAQEMRIEIETLFSNCTRDDLVLLYFSGHGITDENNRFYFAGHDTQKSEHGLIRSTAVASRTVHDFMEDSRSKRKVVILDCCYSGAFARGMTAKKLMDVVDIQSQLGGEGRAILTSSTSTQYSFEQKESELSIYTRFLVEGLDTGAADCDEDGVISAEDLHTYARKKVQEATPAMKPEFYASREGFNIFLADVWVNDPVTKYRREVKRLAEEGTILDVWGGITDVVRDGLDESSRALGISQQEAESIEMEVLKPYRIRKSNARKYARHVLSIATNTQGSLNDKERKSLDFLRQKLDLSVEDANEIEQDALQILEADLPSIHVLDETSLEKLDDAEENVSALPANIRPKEYSPKANITWVQMLLLGILAGFIATSSNYLFNSWSSKQDLNKATDLDTSSALLDRAPTEVNSLGVNDTCVIQPFSVEGYSDMDWLSGPIIGRFGKGARVKVLELSDNNLLARVEMEDKENSVELDHPVEQGEKAWLVVNALGQCEP